MYKLIKWSQNSWIAMSKKWTSFSNNATSNWCGPVNKAEILLNAKVDEFIKEAILGYKQ